MNDATELMRLVRGETESEKTMKQPESSYRSNKRAARIRWQNISAEGWKILRSLTSRYQLSVSSGDLILLDGKWYVTHSGLLALARRNKCCGIHVEAVGELCDTNAKRFVFKATAYPCKTSAGFVGHGDADPSNVSSLVQGAVMRVAETRAVNRALRKAYGIGICSVEEIGSRDPISGDSEKFPPQPNNGNGNGSTIRDRLYQIIRQYRLDPNLVKLYAADFCGAKALKEATREQVESFVAHLADSADKDRNALLCQLNGYLGQKEGAA